MTTNRENCMRIATSNVKNTCANASEIRIEDRIPQWVYDREFDIHKSIAWASGDQAYIERETEKAVLVTKRTDFGKVKLWVPKSVMIREDAAESQIERLAKEAFRFVANSCYDNYLHDVAAANGVKVGNLHKWDKIIAKMASKGVSVMTKAEWLEAEKA